MASIDSLFNSEEDSDYQVDEEDEEDYDSDDDDYELDVDPGELEADAPENLELDLIAEEVHDGEDVVEVCVPGGSINGVEMGDGFDVASSSSAVCPVCYEPWTSEGPHRVCCILCGHVYGRSCLERWAQRCGSNNAKCPQCSRKFREKDIINLFAPVIGIQDHNLSKETQLDRPVTIADFDALRTVVQRLAQQVQEQKQQIAYLFQQMASQNQNVTPNQENVGSPAIGRRSSQGSHSAHSEQNSDHTT